ELTYIAGPALLGGVLAARSTSLALVVNALLLVAGAVALLTHGPLRRATAPSLVARGPSVRRSRAGALSAPGVVVLALAFAGLGAALLLAGVGVAPGFATAYGLTSRIAPEGTTTEAFSWLSTGIAVGVAGGSAFAGLLADGPGPRLAFLAGAITPLAAAALLR